MPSLVQLSDHGSVAKSWELGDQALTFGRGEAARARIEDAKLSREHFTISSENGFHYIADNQSTNGTIVNGRRLAQRERLFDNDQIKAGSYLYRYVVGTSTMLGVAEKAMGAGFKTQLRSLYQKAGG